MADRTRWPVVQIRSLAGQKVMPQVAAAQQPRMDWRLWVVVQMVETIVAVYQMVMLFVMAGRIHLAARLTVDQIHLAARLTAGQTRLQLVAGHQRPVQMER